MPAYRMFAYWGVLLLGVGFVVYLSGIAFSIVRLVLFLDDWAVRLTGTILWYSGIPTTLGLLLILADFLLLFQKKRTLERRLDTADAPVHGITVALTAYNDEDSIAGAVHDFQAHPRVRRVIVVNNNSRDATGARAAQAGAHVVNETRQGYGYCVYRCIQEALRFEDAGYIAICEGDSTFRAFDLDKLAAYAAHADLVNGTRIVEQLRGERTQLTTFMYYANFIGGKLLEVKHLGRGTFTDVGTTYKLMTRAAAERLAGLLDPAVNLEFNVHLLDRALAHGLLLVECPITFHPRIGVSKGGNVNNRRAIKVGFRMFWGLTFGWAMLRQPREAARGEAAGV